MYMCSNLHKTPFLAEEFGLQGLFSCKLNPEEREKKKKLTIEMLKSNFNEFTLCGNAGKVGT